MVNLRLSKEFVGTEQTTDRSESLGSDGAASAIDACCTDFLFQQIGERLNTLINGNCHDKRAQSAYLHHSPLSNDNGGTADLKWKICFCAFTSIY
jgi:hypothetical protein